MNNPNRFPIFQRRPRPTAGAALALTLGMLVLLSGLVLAFLLMVRTEFGAAKAYEGGTSARLLADSALNLVIGQIREGSTQPKLAWISQPGLIRTFDTDGKPVKSYKLYSADSLVEDGSFAPPDPAVTTASGDLPASDASAPDYWKKQPGLWVDINAPVADLTRKNPFDSTLPMMTYPIFDGTHLKMATDLTTGFPEAAKGSLQLSLDGPDKNGNCFADIEGFKVTDRYSDGGASMPVKWLYMLKDGTLVPAKASGTEGDVEVLVPDDKKLTAQGDFNGVVARIAFWTDDESAKVNLNTASEGTYWDTPASNGQPDVADIEDVVGTNGYMNPTLASQPKIGAALTPAAAAVAPILTSNPHDPNVFSPEDATFEWEYMHNIGANKEYQSYTGHPATTCLSTIFGRQLKLRIDPTSAPTLQSKTRAKMCEEIFKMVPRVTGAQYPANDPTYTLIADNSSKAGTVRPNNGERVGYAPPDPSALSTPKLTPDGERLYASVDEFLYNPNFAATSTSGDQRTAWKLAEPDATGARDKTREMLEMSKFFLTANSKAPEQNSFNLPRISIWPVHVSTGKRTAFDKVFAFCSTIRDPSSSANELPFYFDRQNCESTTQDLSTRNQALLDYIYRLTSARVPGWNLNGAARSTFALKYGTDHTQILAEIFDYIRCVNLCDVSEPDTSGNYPSTYAAPTWKLRQSWETTANLPTKTRGSVAPITIPTIGGAAGGRGMGRFSHISQMMFIATRKLDDTEAISSPDIKGGNWVPQYRLDASGDVIKYKVTDPSNPPPYPAMVGSPLIGTPVPVTQGQSDDALIQFLFLPELYNVMAGYTVGGLNMRISFSDIDFTVDVLDINDNPIAGQTGLKPFDNVVQPTMYTDGVPPGQRSTFDYTNGGPSGVVWLLPHAYTKLTQTAPVPSRLPSQLVETVNAARNRSSAPPSALLVVKNAGSVKKGFAGGRAAKLKITAKFKTAITSPISLTPTNTTNEPVIQTNAFDWGTFTVPLPEPMLGIPPLEPVDKTLYPYHILYTNFLGNKSGSNQCGMRFNTSATEFNPGPGGNYYSFITVYDVVKTLQAIGNGIQGDHRMLAGRSDIDSSFFKPAPLSTAVDYAGRRNRYDLQNLYLDRWRGDAGASFKEKDFVAGNTSGSTTGTSRGSLVRGISGAKQHNALPLNDEAGTKIDGVTNYLSTPGASGTPIYGDWDSGPFSVMDGALCNKADEGNTPMVTYPEGSGWGTAGYYGNLTAYMGNELGAGGGSGLNQGDNQAFQAGGLFSPNRQIASAVMFGSLSTGLKRLQPWQTLLFRPSKYYWPGGNNNSPFTPSTGTPYATIEHPGSAKYGPPDHLLLDLFWMPVVEPYPISEPFSTSGKINLNQQIVPFTNIRRDTALRAVLKSVKIAALNPNQQSSNTAPKFYIDNYKAPGVPIFRPKDPTGGATTSGIISRRSIDLDNTLKQITDRLDKNKPFIFASEICDIPLIPKDVPLVTTTATGSKAMRPMKQHVSAQFAPNTPLADFDSKLAAFWLGNGTPVAAPNSHKLTGDNLLERPYTAIYPRLTTRSNSYTVHVRVQTLPQNVGNKTYILKAAKNQPTGEFRGSYVLDRYLDPNTAGIYEATDTTFATKVTTNIIPGQHVLGPYRFRVVSSKQFAP